MVAVASAELTRLFIWCHTRDINLMVAVASPELTTIILPLQNQFLRLTQQHTNCPNSLTSHYRYVTYEQSRIKEPLTHAEKSKWPQLTPLIHQSRMNQDAQCSSIATHLTTVTYTHTLSTSSTTDTSRIDLCPSYLRSQSFNSLCSATRNKGLPLTPKSVSHRGRTFRYHRWPGLTSDSKVNPE